jgi:hypothetical protein
MSYVKWIIWYFYVNSKYIFHFSLSYLDKLEKTWRCWIKIIRLSSIRRQNRPDITELKEYFSYVQLANGRNPETTINSDYVDVYKVSFFMRTIGYFPTETEVNRIIAVALSLLFTLKKHSSIEFL